MIVAHDFEYKMPTDFVGMLLPLAEWKHQDILNKYQKGEIAVGDTISDWNGREAQVVEMFTLDANSREANALSCTLYGRPISRTKKRMEEKWPLWDNKLLYLVVKVL